MSSYMLGMMLKDNLMDGRSSRMKAYSDYTGLVVPPCGEFAPKSESINLPPWMPLQANVGFSQRLSLHREIEHFTAYMKPTREERAMRKDLVTRFTSLIKSLAPSATVRAVGSCVTGLYFPSSDIDMVITASDSVHYGNRYFLSNLERKIRASGFSSKIESVLQASVPLLRITDAVTGIEIDLTVTDGHGEKATAAVISWMKEGDAALIEGLVMVLKLFLSIRRLGTTFTGGVNSYLLVWMVVAWVKLDMPGKGGPSASRTRSDRPVDLDDLVAGLGSMSMASSSESASTVAISQDLGAALLGFLRFYGRDFDYTTKAIRFTSTGVQYTVKTLGTRYRTTPHYLLSITDPANPMVEMGEKAYGIKHVRETFRNAHASLLALMEGSARRDELVRVRIEGILGSVLRGDYTNFTSRRKRILSRWRSHTLCNP